MITYRDMLFHKIDFAQYMYLKSRSSSMGLFDTTSMLQINSLINYARVSWV